MWLPFDRCETCKTWRRKRRKQPPQTRNVVEVISKHISYPVLPYRSCKLQAFKNGEGNSELQIFRMRFKTSVKNIQTFSSKWNVSTSLQKILVAYGTIELTASLSSLGKVAWVRLDDNGVRFTIIPETGTQVWA